MLRRSLPVLATAVRCETASRARRSSVLVRVFRWACRCRGSACLLRARPPAPSLRGSRREAGVEGADDATGRSRCGASVRGQSHTSMTCANRMWMGAAGRGHAPCALLPIPSAPDRRVCWLCACVVLRVCACGRVRVRLGHVDVVQLGRREDCFQGCRPLRCPRLQHQ